MLPARQGLHALHAAGGDLDDGHVEHAHLVALQSHAQIDLQLITAHGAVVLAGEDGGG
jgi:hypothetical protein